MAVFVANCFGCEPIAQLSAGPDNNGRLRDLTGKPLGISDREAYFNLSKDRYGQYFRSQRIPISDAQAIRAINEVSQILETQVIPYALLPELSDPSTCNSNCVPGAVVGRRVYLGVSTPGGESYRRLLGHRRGGSAAGGYVSPRVRIEIVTFAENENKKEDGEK